MKKRILLIGLLAIIGFLAIIYGIDAARRQHVRHHQLALMIPAEPLAYIQCAHLKTRLAQFTNSPDYQTFVQSAFVKHLQQTEGWRNFSEVFTQLWKSLLIDPLHIIGDEIVLGVYKTEVGEVIPGTILISKVDRVARLSEQILYVVDQVTHQTGLKFDREFHQVPIYKIGQREMIYPLYYAIIDDIGMLATSRSLLERAIRLAIGLDTRPESSSLWHTIASESPTNRFVTGYLDSPIFLAELRKLFRALELDESIAWQTADVPVMTIRLDTGAKTVALRVECFPDSNVSAYANENLKDQVNNRLLETQIPANVAATLSLERTSLPIFLQNWQAVFPQWAWNFPIQTANSSPEIFGKMVECTLVKTLTGMVYALPEVSCILDTQRPDLALSRLNATLNNVITQTVPSFAQGSLVKMADESYRNTVMTNVQVMFQDMLSYAAVAGQSQQVSPGYVVLSTNKQAVKNQIDARQTQPDNQPYILPVQSKRPPIICWLHNKNLSAWLQKFSQTNTFALLLPPSTSQQSYQDLPWLVQGLQTLPPVWLEAGAVGKGIYLEIINPGIVWRSHESSRVAQRMPRSSPDRISCQPVFSVL